MKRRVSASSRRNDLARFEGHLADNADLTLTIDRADLEQTMAGAKPLADQIADGTAQIEGDPTLLTDLAAMMVHFKLRFEIMPGTGPETMPTDDLNPFEVGNADPPTKGG